VPLVCASNWYILDQYTLHGVIRDICTSLSVLRPNLWVSTWTYNRDFTAEARDSDVFSTQLTVLCVCICRPKNRSQPLRSWVHTLLKKGARSDNQISRALLFPAFAASVPPPLPPTCRAAPPRSFQSPWVPGESSISVRYLCKSVLSSSWSSPWHYIIFNLIKQMARLCSWWLCRAQLRALGHCYLHFNRKTIQINWSKTIMFVRY